MAKQKLIQVSEEEIKQMISLSIGAQAAEIAEGVFRKMFEESRKHMEGRVSQIIYGGIIATVLVLASLVASTWMFMNTYQQHYLDTQAHFNEEINDLRKDNYDLQMSLNNEINIIKGQQQNLENILLTKKDS